TYIGLSNTLITPATVTAPILGGWLIDTYGFGSTFGLATIIGIIAAVVLIFVVKDPHKHVVPTSRSTL
ncbi:MAG TPA: hypothetical protein PKK96_11680, partial [Anaerolineales bacterium]|nr:hypothetical protein [Anaerolineales bacterium]